MSAVLVDPASRALHPTILLYDAHPAQGSPHPPYPGVPASTVVTPRCDKHSQLPGLRPGRVPSPFGPCRRGSSRASWHCSLLETSPQTASSTHWPSWSQAPSSWGWPKSPAWIGPSTAETISARVISVGLAGEHVATADPPLGPDEPGPLQGEQDLLQVGLGEPGALGDVPHRGRAAVVVQREARAAPGSRSRPASRPASSRDYDRARGRRGPPGRRLACWGHDRRHRTPAAAGHRRPRRGARTRAGAEDARRRPRA